MSIHIILYEINKKSYNNKTLYSLIFLAIQGLLLSYLI